MCCKWWKWRTGGPKGSQNGNPTSDLQVAADRIILCAVRWYLRYSLSLRDVEELLDERELNWSSGYGDISSRPTNPGASTRPTFECRAAGATLYRAINSAGATIDFLLSALRDTDAAKRLFRNALRGRSQAT